VLEAAAASSTRAGALPLPRSFYGRNALRLARALLGKVLVHRVGGRTSAGRIVETEAYRGPLDQAAHTANGRRTERNEVMWGPPGHAYVYFVYGMHWCLNVVAAKEGQPEAVLLRALEPIDGLPLIAERRAGNRKTPVADARLLSGPACLCRGMGVDGSLNGADLTMGRMVILDAPPVPAHRIQRVPRVGVDYAGEDAVLPWRLFVDDSPSVSRRA